MKLNNKKKPKENQKYENYWSSTMALTNFDGPQFVNTLSLIIEHIDKYKLNSISISKLKNNRELIKRDELQTKIRSVFPNDSTDGASTRKQMNEYVKLGFIKPFLNGYVPSAREYIASNTNNKKRKTIFSDIVYQYSSFNSSVTNDDSKNNQIKFLINTLINKKAVNGIRSINMDELVGLMQINISGKKYATEKEILFQKNWASYMKFASRKYNQINHLLAILRNLNLLCIQGRGKDARILLSKDADKLLPTGDTKRDPYRFANMRKSVLEESRHIYGKEICWLTKQPSEGLVVSHIYASAEALKKWDLDAAYDPNNAFLLKPGDVDQYFDKKKITFDKSGKVIFSNKVRKDFKRNVLTNKWHIDKTILNPERLKYLKKHNQEFIKKNSNQSLN